MAGIKLSLPGSVGSPKRFIKKEIVLIDRGGFKSKEIDSGRVQWETTTNGKLRPKTMHNATATRPLPSTGTFYLLNTTFRPGQLPVLFVDNLVPLVPFAWPNVFTLDFFKHELREAQLHFPGELCVIIGNLNNTFSDLILTMKVINLYSGYGEVYGAVFRRVVNGVEMPYAILQFTDAGSAAAARLNLRADDHNGHELDGRYLRCQKSYASRKVMSFYLGGVVPSF